MRAALDDADTGRQQNGGRATVGAVMVDPAVGKGRLVATASRERQRVRDEGPLSFRDHPLHHAVMLCVQGVGRALAAGQAQETAAEKRKEDGEATAQEELEGEASGNKLPRQEVGEREGAGRKGRETRVAEIGAKSDACGAVEVEQEVLSPEQYLCTGFDLYITREPCLM